MEEKRDYYEILGVDQNADAGILKKAFRKLAMEYHPDRNPEDNGDAAARFREAQEAYEVLCDSQKRSLYDQFGHAGLSRSGFRPTYSSADMGDLFGGFQSIFEDFFGGGAQQAQRGQDLLYRLNLNFKEAVLGCSKNIKIKRNESCSDCHGSGCASGRKPETCNICHGRGKISRNQGFFMISQSCHHCHGTGQIIQHPCKKCHGSGQIKKEKEVHVQIPAGVDTGIRLRVSHEGEASPHGGAHGDLYVEINVEADKVFERDGVDLYTKIYVPYPTAVFGGEIEVPLIEGSKTVKVPASMKAPHQLILRSEGVKDIRGHGRGSLVIEMHIETPEKLSKRAKELLEELKGELGSKEAPSEAPKKKTKKKKSFFGVL